MKQICGETYQQERALYAISDTELRDCRFAGPVDGESPLKESRGLSLDRCYFDLRYPMWHMSDSALSHCEMTESCRAALWYDRNLSIRDSQLHGIKALRECKDTTLETSDVISDEFGWMCHGVNVRHTSIRSMYPFFHSCYLNLDDVQLYGKYSFQYVKDVLIRNSRFETKDAFWHAENVTVIDSVVSGEYLGWYSNRLTLIHCRISGTQPLCYANNLTMIDCRMNGCDFSFENSSISATVIGSIDSIRLPDSGYLRCDGIGTVFTDNKQDGQTSCVIDV